MRFYLRNFRLTKRLPERINFVSRGSNVYRNEIYDEALEFYEILLKIYQNNNKIISNNINNTKVISSGNKKDFAVLNIVKRILSEQDSNSVRHAI